MVFFAHVNDMKIVPLAMLYHQPILELKQLRVEFVVLMSAHTSTRTEVRMKTAKIAGRVRKREKKIQTGKFETKFARLE